MIQNDAEKGMDAALVGSAQFAGLSQTTALGKMSRMTTTCVTSVG
jgi:hypothetical protein